MKGGHYRGVCRRYAKPFLAVWAVSFFIIFFGFALGSGVAMFLLMATYSAVYIAIMSITANMPCCWSADETGFTITEYRKDFRHSYGDIKSADIDMIEGRSRDGIKSNTTTAVLTITEFSGKKSTYSERVNTELREFRTHSENCLKPQLMKLYELLEEKTGTGR